MFIVSHEILLTMLMEQQTVTNLAVIRGLCAMTKQQCILAQAHPLMIKHLTSIYCKGTYSLGKLKIVIDQVMLR